MSLRRLVALLTLAALLVGVGTASARDPRLEQQRLTPADMRLAKRAVLQRGDLAAGWRSLRVGQTEGERLQCDGFDPDFSRFVLTGRAITAFAHPEGASLTAAVEVYRTRADAAGDFRVGTQPGVVRCLRGLLDDAFGAGTVPLRVRSARRVSAPRLGERTAAYRVVATLTANGRSIPLYLDVLVFGRGRSLASLLAVSAYNPMGDRLVLARTMVSRMR
ncbi:MAG TPA: hypothetical protein VK874_06560 [Gaiellaceae bacterium]|nr:hypothetical protein [Gaiellaceae bacterium]